MNWPDQIFYDFKKGNIDSFYKYIFPDILVYATSLLRGELAVKAEDCVQDAIEVSYRRRNQFTSPAQWKAFIITCIRNRAISIMRHNEAHENYISDRIPEEFTEDVLQDYINLETRVRIYNAIASLPEELKQIFNLSFEEGLRNKEIARQLEVAEITIKKRKARMLGLLSDLLKDDFVFLFFI